MRQSPITSRRYAAAAASRQPQIRHVGILLAASLLVGNTCFGQVFDLPNSSATVSPGLYEGTVDDLFDLRRGTSIVSATPQLFNVRFMLGDQGGPAYDPNTIFADGGPLGSSGSVLFALPDDALISSIALGLNQDGSNPRRGAARYVLEGLSSSESNGVVLSEATFATDYFSAYGDAQITVKDDLAVPFWGRFFRLTVFQQTDFYGVRVNELDGFGETPDTATTIDVPEGRVRQGEAGYAEIVGDEFYRKSGPGTLELDAANGFTGWLLVSEGTVLLSDAAAISRGRVAVSDNAVLEIGAGTSASVPQVHLAGSSRLDIGTGSLTVNDGLTSENVLAGLLEGRGTGTWDGTAGITSSQAAIDLENGLLRSVGWKENPDGSVTVAYAAPGDVNLDGEVNIFDLVDVSSSGKYGEGTASVWSQGDFDYNGATNIFDMVLVNGAGVYGAGNYLPESPAVATVTVVPEPSLLGTELTVIAYGGWRIWYRRRARRLSPSGLYPLA